jgi:hypothetical protein
MEDGMTWLDIATYLLSAAVLVGLLACAFRT